MDEDFIHALVILALACLVVIAVLIGPAERRGTPESPQVNSANYVDGISDVSCFQNYEIVKGHVAKRLCVTPDYSIGPLYDLTKCGLLADGGMDSSSPLELEAWNNKNYCILQRAIYRGEPETCQNITNIEGREFWVDECLSEVAGYLDEPSICDQIQDNVTKDTCLNISIDNVARWHVTACNKN